MSRFKQSCIKVSLITVCVLLMSACVSTVRTTVSTYSSANELPKTATFSIQMPADIELEVDELEFGYFAGRLGEKLSAQGFGIVNKDEASHIVFLQYDTLRQKKKRDRSRVQMHSSIGYRYSYGSVVVLDGKDYDQYEFARRIKITIEKNTPESDEGKKVLSLAAVSYGSCEHLGSVFDEMAIAIVKNLYSENGSVTPVSVKTKRPCSGEG